MRIGDLAQRAGVDVQTVRYYEREGLLDAPARTPAGYRNYAPQDVERLTFVRHCRSLDMSLADIRRLLALASKSALSCDHVNALIDAQLERVHAKRLELEALETQLSALRAQCTSGRQIADCGILEELIHAAQGEACACHRSCIAENAGT
jgi:Cd(II)/Pb(II)-responsive transcriptional regulator